jgi:antitoxin component YwqK of YwqJK toxin-antitoxin module
MDHFNLQGDKFHMRGIYSIIMVLLLVQCSNDIDYSDLDYDKNTNISYLKGTSTPYTGKLVSSQKGDNSADVGYYKNGLRDSVWTSSRDGVIIGQYTFSGGQLHGLFSTKNDSGKYIMGVKDGYWVEGGGSGNYIDGIKDGLWEGIWAEKHNSDIMYKNGKRHGRTILYYGTGKKKVEQREYKNDIRHGTWIKWQENGDTVRVESYADEKKSGVFKRYYENGTVNWITNFKDGIKHGISEKWFDNGVMEWQVTYDEGVKEGVYKRSNKLGTYTSAVNYRDDKRHGELREFSNGTLTGSHPYQNGLAHGKTSTFYNSGKKHYVKYHEHGKRVGLWEAWREGGEKKVVANFTGRKSSQKFVSWHKNGKVHIEADLYDGEAHGVYMQYWNDGQPFVKGFHSKGFKVGEWEYFYQYGGNPKEDFGYKLNHREEFIAHEFNGDFIARNTTR